MPFRMAQAPVDTAVRVKIMRTDTLAAEGKRLFLNYLIPLPTWVDYLQHLWPWPKYTIGAQHVSLEDFNPESDAVPATHTPPLVATEHKNRRPRHDCTPQRQIIYFSLWQHLCFTSAHKDQVPNPTGCNWCSTTQKVEWTEANSGDKTWC